MKCLPYPGYKQSSRQWLTEVPTQWSAFALKFLTDRHVKDGPHETPTFVDAGVPFFSVDGIQDNKLVLEGCRYISRRDHERYSQKCRPAKGDVLLGKAASIGKVAFVELDCEFNVWSPLAVIRPKDRSMGKFIYYAFQSSYLQAQCLVQSNSNTQNNLGMRTIDNLIVPVPPPEEQSTVADFLDYATARIDALIEKQQQLIALLKEKRQAVISHAVTKGLNPNAPCRDSGVEWLGMVPAHWQVCRVKQAASFITSGPRGWSDLITDDGADIFLQSGDLNDAMGLIFATAKRISPPRNAEGIRTRMQAGDVVVCITGANTGRVAVADELPADTYVNQHLSLVRPISSAVAPRFLATVLSSAALKAYFAVAQYGLKGGLSLTNVAEAPIVLPPLDEQRLIVKELRAKEKLLDTLEMAATAQIGLLQERRTALISAAVTGKIDVRNWTPPESKPQRDVA